MDLHLTHYHTLNLTKSSLFAYLLVCVFDVLFVFYVGMRHGAIVQLIIFFIRYGFQTFYRKHQLTQVYITIQKNTIQYHAIQYNTIQSSTTRYNTITYDNIP